MEGKRKFTLEQLETAKDVFYQYMYEKRRDWLDAEKIYNWIDALEDDLDDEEEG